MVELREYAGFMQQSGTSFHYKIVWCKVLVKHIIHDKHNIVLDKFLEGEGPYLYIKQASLFWMYAASVDLSWVQVALSQDEASFH